MIYVISYVISYVIISMHEAVNDESASLNCI